MEFQVFLTKISKIKKIINHDNYSGLVHQLLMTPQERLSFDTSKVKSFKEAATLALFYPKNKETYFLLTLRADYNGTHASQVSFPGGKINESDRNLLDTALRETSEEIGIKPSLIKEVISLSKVYIPPSNFWVSPYLGILNDKPHFIKNYEVKTLIEVSLTDLLDNNSVINKKITTSYAKDMNVPCFLFNNHVVWGATAMILSEIKEILKLAVE